ncbi:MAG: CHC2 zinc finger domain-containing protein, partial [Acidobacteriota bacterium]
GVAERYHRALPQNIRRYLNARGIPDKTIDQHLLGWSGTRITIPVFGRNGNVIQFRFAKSPDDLTESPKVLSELGAAVELYGWETLAEKPRRVVICEGEFDRLVLEARGFEAVTSTGGALSFLREWASAFEKIRHVYICFDRDDAGEAGARRVQSYLPQAEIVKLPADVGMHGDVTDFFVALERTPLDFEILLAEASAAEAPDEPIQPARSSSTRPAQKALQKRAERVKQHVSLPELVSNYIELQAAGAQLVGRCPFHNEKTPSFTIYRSTNTYHCFGCGKNGDAITFLMTKESMPFKEALETLERFHKTHELFGTAA